MSVSAQAIERLTRKLSNERTSGKATIKSTGQQCFLFFWKASTDQPWKEGYSRVMIPLNGKSRSGKTSVIQIVKDSNLIFGA